MTDSTAHWEEVYRTKEANRVSWFRSHLDSSIRLIRDAVPNSDAEIIDVGAGHSRLADDLLAAGYRHLTLVDLSSHALDQTRARLGASADRVCFVGGDVTQIDLSGKHFDVWHDRAVFHFLTEDGQRRAYVQQLDRALRYGGHAVLATFGPNGPMKCSGLNVVRYDASALSQILGASYELRESFVEAHETPAGSVQEFQYTLFRKITAV